MQNVFDIYTIIFLALALPIFLKLRSASLAITPTSALVGLNRINGSCAV